MIVKYHLRSADCLNYVTASSGITDVDFQKLSAILDRVSIPFICLDVANGYSEGFVDYVRRVREAFPTETINMEVALTDMMIMVLRLF